MYEKKERGILIVIFPLPHVFPPPPFPLEREPTASAPRGDTLGTRIDRDISLIMPPSLVRRLRSNMAQSDGTTVKLGARYGRRLATPIPSSNTHIPCISTLRTSRNLPQPQRSCYITCAQRRYHSNEVSGNNFMSNVPSSYISISVPPLCVKRLSMPL